jgi:hypothetical protein
LKQALFDNDFLAVSLILSKLGRFPKLDDLQMYAALRVFNRHKQKKRMILDFLNSVSSIHKYQSRPIINWLDCQIRLYEYQKHDASRKTILKTSSSIEALFSLVFFFFEQ